MSEIGNLPVEISKGIKLNNRDYLNALLTSLKELTKNYAIFLTEVSNEDLYKGYAVTFQKISKLQRDTYELLFQKGWYKLEEALQTKIEKKANMLSQEYADLNN